MAKAYKLITYTDNYSFKSNFHSFKKLIRNLHTSPNENNTTQMPNTTLNWACTTSSKNYTLLKITRNYRKLLYSLWNILYRYVHTIVQNYPIQLYGTIQHLYYCLLPRFTSTWTPCLCWKTSTLPCLYTFFTKCPFFILFSKEFVFKITQLHKIYFDFFYSSELHKYN